MSTVLPLSALERRADPRLPLSLEVVLDQPHGSPRCLSTRDLSLGGACLEGGAAGDLRVGERLSLSLRLPGTPHCVQTTAEVRWSSRMGRCGVAFTAGARGLIAGLLAAATALGPTVGSAAQAVPTFDPAGPVDLDAYPGSDRPDDATVMSAFEQQYEDIDRCVERAKKGRDGVLAGSAAMQVLLNPSGERPLGINATIDGPQEGNRKLVECLRDATSRAPFPAYDGPPVVVALDFELDPGTEEVAAEDEYE